MPEMIFVTVRHSSTTFSSGVASVAYADEDMPPANIDTMLKLVSVICKG